MTSVGGLPLIMMIVMRKSQLSALIGNTLVEKEGLIWPVE